MPRQTFDSVAMQIASPPVIECEPKRLELHATRVIDASRRLLPPAPPAEPRSILIVGDDPAIRKLLRRLLDRRGYVTHEIADASEIPGEMQRRPVDLLIIDAMTDVRDPEILFSFARARPDLKILALSLDSVQSALPPGCLRLTKPFSLDRFLECVDRLLSAPAPAEQK